MNYLFEHENSLILFVIPIFIAIMLFLMPFDILMLDNLLVDISHRPVLCHRREHAGN